MDIEVNPAERTVTRSGLGVELAPREYELLLALLRRRSAAVSRGCGPIPLGDPRSGAGPGLRDVTRDGRQVADTTAR